MIWARIVAIACCLCFLSGGARAGEEKPALERIVPVAPGEQIPLTDFVRPYLFMAPQINRAGTYLGAIVTNTFEARDLVLVNLDSGSMDRLSADVAQDIYSFSWLTDDRILFATSIRREYANEMRVVRIDHPGSSYPVVRYSLVSLVSVPENNRLRPIIWIRGDAFSGDDQGPVQIDALEHLDERGGQAGNTFYLQENRSDRSMLKIASSYPAPAGTKIDYIADKDGELAYATTFSGGVYTLNRLAGDHWERCPVDLDKVNVFGAGDRPGEIIAAPVRGNGLPGPIERMDAVTGAPGEVLYQDRRYGFDDAWIYRDPAARTVAGFQLSRRGVQDVWIDPEYQAIQEKLERSFPGQTVRIEGSDDAKRRFVVQTSSDVNPGAFFLVDFNRHSVGLLKKAAPWLDSSRLRPMKVVSYRARDGAVIEAYLTLPAGVSKEKPVPLVVFPHGGPWVRDVWGYNPVVQLLASRGYAVFQPNYRGSAGFDSRYPEGDKYDFVKMRNDVTDGTNFLVRLGFIDRNRIAIMGGSFGGYLALCGAAFEPDLYRCAVTISGVFDWGRVMDEARQDNYFDSVRYGFFRRHLGDPRKDPAKFDAISPLRHIDKVKIPIFVFHGWDDGVASIAESKALVAALDAQGIPNETHFLEEGGTRVVPIR